MQIALFCIETVLIIFMIGFFVRTKAYKSITAIFYWFVINAFYAPAVYYIVLDGSAYRVFDKQTLTIYLTIGIIYILAFLATEAIWSRKKVRAVHIRLSVPRFIQGCLVFFTIAVCLGYIVRYHYGFPFLNYFRTGVMVDYRPDTSGAIPHWFIMGTVIMMVVPMFLFYFDEKKAWSGKHFAIFAVLIIPLLVMSGNQGIFVYYVIFLWMYKMHYRISLPLVFLGVLALLIHSILKGDAGVISLEGPLRRFFVTQGAGLLARIQMIRNGFDFSGKWIADEVFTFIYGKSGGSHPTFFLGDLMVHFGFPLGICISVVITFIVITIGKMMDERVSLHGKWGFYIILFILGMSSISIRLIARGIIIVFFCTMLEGNMTKKYALLDSVGM